MPKTPPSTLKSTVAEQIEHSVEKLKHISLEEERKPKKSKQKLSFNTSEAATDTQVIDTPDHGYCRPKLVQSKEQDDKVTISEMMERFSVNVSQMLFSAIGDKISMESKLATISTIYGMILHCHNVKACAVQRIFTALCIRYHADNKTTTVMVYIALLERLNKHIEHVQDDAMSQKSEVCWMPVLMKNETCYSDCIQIMKSYEKQILQWYTKGGRANDLDKLKIPVGGDQLTRVRLQGAKACQDGALTAADRLEHMEPIIVEMFHTLQDLLEKMYKRFYKTSSGRDKGTLYNLKLIIERSNVNGNVKSRFEAHEDFVLTVGNAYLLSFIMNKFGMETLDAEPQHPLLKNRNIKFMHNKYKEEVFHTIMGEIVEDLICTFPKLEPKVSLNVEIFNSQFTVNSTVGEGKMLKFELVINNQKVLFNVSLEDAQEGVNIELNMLNRRIPVRISINEKDRDDLQSYVFQFLQWYFVILTFKDAIKEGDSDRTNITLKFCIPIFFSHSILSKYLEECVDYILKTEVLLTEKLAMKVRYGSFVNLTGHKGENKAADLQKENEVLVLKELIRGLGSNKTEKAIDTITKAAPVIQDIVDNFDKMSNISHRNTHHRKRSSEGDIKCILKVIVPLKIWNYTEGRTLESFKKIKKSQFDFERCQFKEAINRKIQRLKRGISVPESSDEESDQE
uniref:DUF6589 domain-containing protein n=1 Tax=Magallana gigas TaxID=29159 RepID=A0A8W8I4B1_MAGGI